MDELSVNREIQGAGKVLMARDEFLTRYCIGWPAVYKATCPFTDCGRKLLNWKAKTEKDIAEDIAVYQATVARPSFGPRPSHIDWSALSASDKLAIGFEDWPQSHAGRDDDAS